MKRILTLALLIALMVGIEAWANGASETSATNTSVPTIELSKVFYFGDASDNPDMKKEFMDAFDQKFNVNLKVNAFPRNNYMEKINLQMTAGDLQGMALIFGPSDVLKSRDDGTILPVDDMLKDNPNWVSQPDAFKSLFKYYGQTWAIPNGFGGQMFMRTIRQDWLDKLGMKLPTTIDDLYNVFKAFTTQDPDGDGKNDTYGLTAAGTWNLQDIFQAYNARLDDTGENSITWDPNQNAWVDSFLNPGMVDALSWLHKVYAEGILDPEVFTNQGSNMRSKFWGGKYGSTYYWESFGFQPQPLLQNVPTAKMSLIPALTGTATKNINNLVKTGPPWVLLKGTPNASQMINAFVNLFYGNQTAALWGAYGIQDKYWTLDNTNKLVVMKNDPKTNQPYTTPGFIGLLPSWTGIQYQMIVAGTDQQQQDAINGLNQSAQLINGGMQNGTIFVVPGSLDAPVSGTYTKLHTDITNLFNEVVSKVTLGNMTAADGIKYYRDQMRSMGAQAVLDEANQAVGLTYDKNKYTY